MERVASLKSWGNCAISMSRTIYCLLGKEARLELGLKLAARFLL
jgi:hypothetical protein